MISILFYSFATIFILFYSGYGLGYLLTPRALKKHRLWLTPWYAIVILIFILVIFGRMGFSISKIIAPLFVLLSFTNFYVFIKNKTIFKINLKEDFIIGAIIIISILSNLSPLFRYYRYPTSLSLGNNDIIDYAVNSDYLIKHPITDSVKGNIPTEVGDLLVERNRWGPPIVISFFQMIFNLKAYQYISIFHAVIYSLMLPLGYILAKIIFRPSLISLVLILTVTAFNSNLLYILYHNFSGQILYWGLELFILIFLIAYIFGAKTKTKLINLYDITLGISISVLFFSYHEGAIFVLFPLLLFYVIQLLLKNGKSGNFWSLIKVMLITGLTSFSTIIKSIIVNYYQSIGANPNQPIGWTLFRNSIPYANPFEMIGLYSIHSFEPLPIFIAILLSLGTIVIIFYGLFKSKNRLFLFCYIAFYSFILFLYSFIYPNFWAYNRSLTFNLPLILVLFSIGITQIVKNRILLKRYILAGIIILELFSAIKLNKRFRSEHLVVDKSLISLQELPSSNSFSEPIFMEGLIDDNIPLWKRIWTSYFLYNGKPLPSLTSIVTPFENRIPDNSLILLSKPTPWFKPPQILLKSTVWENAYYKLGRICNSTECLLDRPENLSSITLGVSEAEDSLLLTGWSVREMTNRWATGEESTLRLITRNSGFNQVSFEAQTLKEPQTVTVYFDGKLLGTKQALTQWSKYTFYIPEGIPKGVHQIRLTYSYSYKPSEILKTQDTRDLALNFRRIWLTQN
ncbi:hypothetical protein A2960_00780 [Candidatus Gottesmanbacteria bacterium RIFCSPLOWO2_01_FULL_39_12b]|uniref:Glycosyltransferase RgtA/B/C/D-like domain-containing protein n=1 Tax=Candidatus Gottesmanbacteria bacterium RIFCSPLOWO2_01_FULL_39_12b TaxID=1798388 RepID=A0A1F6AQD5_9BACT|nr:MAG: hypothetical protein A2960_00780 [Candidatus Gottesmanbacteria bacterium RIFCSPLOWO2_01_FULL_39_12b]